MPEVPCSWFGPDVPQSAQTLLCPGHPEQPQTAQLEVPWEPKAQYLKAYWGPQAGVSGQDRVVWQL